MAIQRIEVIDSHTGGEPTRIVIEGGPDLGTGSMAERLALLRDRHDTLRSAVVNEPRGSDVIVGGLLCEPVDPSATAGIIFFNNVGYLGMCGHGTIGLVVTLAFLGRIKPGAHRIETPVGVVTALLNESGEVTVENVPSYRSATGVSVSVEGYGAVTGDVAWGGNWFYLVANSPVPVTFANVDKLTHCASEIRRALERERISGANGGEIDHIELFGPPEQAGAHSKNYVLCPGGAYDRSPCGTGTSAKLACLAADGKLAEGEIWRQESIVGSVFSGSYRKAEGHAIIPAITGSAWVSARSTLLLDPSDPFVHGIRR